MKKFLMICSGILFLSSQVKANDQITIYQVNQCNPPATGNSYAYVSPKPSVAHVFIDFLQQHCTVISIACDDPGSKDCAFPYTVPGIDFNAASQTVTEQMNNGIMEGQIYSDGTTGTGTLENFTSEPNTASFIWGTNGSPTCRTIKVVYNDGVE